MWTKKDEKNIYLIKKKTLFEFFLNWTDEIVKPSSISIIELASLRARPGLNPFERKGCLWGSGNRCCTQLGLSVVVCRHPGLILVIRMGL